MDGRSRRLLLVAILTSIVLIYIYPLALPTPLMDPDEGLHATIAQEMVERGDYLVPRVSGEPFRDKPVLYFAAQAASLRLFGMNEAAIRLPGFLFALFGCATTALLARRLFDGETAIYAALAALTLVLPVALAQSAAHDIALVPWINLLVLCYWEQEKATAASRRWRWIAGGAVCIALALLTKGLIGIALVTSGIAMYAIVTRSLSWSLLVRCAVVLLAGGALASPWFVKMEYASPGYAYYYFVQRHFLGFVTEGQEHGDVSWYYYLGPVAGWRDALAGLRCGSRLAAKVRCAAEPLEPSDPAAVVLVPRWFPFSERGWVQTPDLFAATVSADRCVGRGWLSTFLPSRIRADRSMVVYCRLSD